MDNQTAMARDLLPHIPPVGQYPCRGACGATVALPGVCDACAQADARRARGEALAAVYAGIPSGFRWAALDDPTLARRCPALAGWQASLAQLTRYQVVLIVGVSGLGKTSIACAMLRSRIDAGQWPASEADYGRASRSRFFAAREITLPREDPTQPAWAPLVRSASFAVIDDVGQEAASDGYKATDRTAKLAELLFDRHDRGLPTVVTTAHRRDRWQELYGDGLARRFWSRDERVRVVDLDAAASKLKE